MIVPDVNLLVYAYNTDAPRHSRAREWWEETLSGVQSTGLPWIVCIGFLRIMTSRSVLVTPMTPAEALKRVQSWISLPQVELLQPGPRHLEILESFANCGALASHVMTDAHIAAIAMELRAEVHSNDSDFARFPGLRWRNPIP